MKDMTKGSPVKLMLGFAIPLFIGNMVQLGYNLTDTWIVGRTISKDAIAQIGSTSALSSLMIGFLNGLCNGFSMIIARYFGAHDEKGLKKAVAHSIMLGTVTAIVISFFCLIFLKPLLRFFNVSDSLIVPAASYIRIIFAGMIITLLYNLASGILRAVGDTFMPMVYLIIAALLNVGLDFFFILVLKTGVGGAAAATVIAQCVSVILCFIHIYRHYPLLIVSKYDFCPDIPLISKLYGTGLSMAMMLSLVYVGTAALSMSINKLGDNIIIAHTATRKVTELFMLPFGVFGATMAIFCGQNLGAKKIDRIQNGLKQIILLTWIWCIGTVIVSYTVLPYIIKFITSSDNKEIIYNATLYQKFDTLFYFVPAVITIGRNSLQAIGDKISPLVSSCIEMIAKIIAAMLLTPVFGYWGIIVAEPISWCLMVIPLIISFVKSPILKKNREQPSRL